MNATTNWVFDWPGRLPIAESFCRYGDKKRAVGVHGRLSRLTSGWQSQIVGQGCRAGASSGVLRTCRSIFSVLLLGFPVVLTAQEAVNPTFDQPTSSGESVVNQNQTSACQTPANSTPEMVVIPGGTFTMGSPDDEEGRFYREGPQREVSVATFAIGRCEVTFTDWQRCVDDRACEAKGDRAWGRGQRPVIQISWREAQSYISWLNSKTNGLYRLPTEAEWEYAARAGTTTAYSWGNAPSGQHANGSESLGWPDDGYKSETAPAASFKPNPWGLYDMHGNVWEWVEDCWHDDYKNAPEDGSAWLEANGGNCKPRVVRGGSWGGIVQLLRSASRDRDNADERGKVLGFRLARTLEKE